VNNQKEKMERSQKWGRLKEGTAGTDRRRKSGVLQKIEASISTTELRSVLTSCQERAPSVGEIEKKIWLRTIKAGNSLKSRRQKSNG